MVAKSTKRIIVGLSAIFMIVIGALPFFSAPTVLASIPPGYSETDSTTVIMPYNTAQEAAYLNGSPAGFSDFSIDHDAFPFDITLGGRAITIVDVYQTDTANYIVVEYQGLQGNLIISGDISQGVDIDIGSIYVTNAMFPTRSGGYRTSAGEYFYGLEQATLVIARTGFSFSLTRPFVSVGGYGVSVLTLIGIAVFAGGVIFAKKKD